MEWNPPQILISTFLALILVGTFILLLPISTTEGISFVDALFTSTSAMTVTGLVVVDTGTAFTTFGEIVIMALIQLGGLGIMTFAVFIYLALGRKIGIRERLLIKQALNQNTLGGVIALAKRLLIFSLVVEAMAVVFLTLEWGADLGWGRALYASVFHAISAFNNAGFSIWSDSLSGYVGDPVVNLVITILFIIGGIGFTVVFDMWKSKDFSQLSLHSKLMILGTIGINVISFFMIFVLEYNNPNTLASMSTPDQIQASYFQAVTPRTAGFNTLDIGSMEHASLFYMIILMFIGGGSASTAGGIKLTTALLIVLATFTFYKQREEVVTFKRSLPYPLILRALSLAMGSVVVVLVAIFILNLTEDAPFLDIVFEGVSAFGTVGLSMGLTGSLTTIGKVTIILTMLIGKLGPLTFAFAFARHRTDRVKYPKEDVLTG
ncbi:MULTISPECIES: TrkH family potassium uptake protein [Pontibacillus]|uniref:TrkH family potassium uptake protein n=1 Tax=Pontibacillus chungwhensis TaxID=265426 RepID=A0ABY8V6G9_9BACI|nr:MULTISPECIES: TrkH family potassium uptake protein [Pontibacillus]MCD5322139.1 TrkH family potassium uptake protein [Pontibacillus sp. HN14]WIG00151.1 TrkH family potassium uptake protein [Pontibacillus chungwhensis]